MFSKKVLYVFLLILVLGTFAVGCSTNNNNVNNVQSTNSSSIQSSSSEPAIKSVSKTETWPGEQIFVELDFNKELKQDQVVVLVGGKQAKMLDIWKNKAKISVPNDLQIGKQGIEVTVDGKKCKDDSSIEIIAPIITNITAYSMGSSLDIEVQNMENNAGEVKVFVNGKVVQYSQVKDGMKAGTWIVNVEIPKEIKKGSVYVTYAGNKTNNMDFSME